MNIIPYQFAKYEYVLYHTIFLIYCLKKTLNYEYYMPTLHLVIILEITFCLYNYLNQCGVKMMHL
jgi:hypothetical protein